MTTTEAGPKFPQPNDRPPRILVATFPGPYSLEAAAQELRRFGVPADNIGRACSDHACLLSVFPPSGRHELITFVLHEQGAVSVGEPSELGLDYRLIPHPGASEDHDMKLPSGREFPATHRAPPLSQGRAHPRRLPKEERLPSFSEVELDLDQAQALREAGRCLHCPEPRCITGCPAGNDIPGFVRAIREGDLARAASILERTSSFPTICGRVCDVGRQCEGACVLSTEGEPVAIGALERFVGKWSRENGSIPVPRIGTALTGAQVAIIGAGPTGLAAAADLASLGHRVTVFEALPVAGGAMAWGIPAFRLPLSVLQAEVDRIKALGVDLCLGTRLGPQMGMDHLLKQGYRAVLVAAGTSASTRARLPGENSAGVFTATDFLTQAKLSRCYQHDAYQAPAPGERLVVIGGGNTAMDVAQTALRLGWRQVTVAYRRSRDEMPARGEDVEGALEEGVEFQFQASPARFLADGQRQVVAVECLRTELGPPDASGRRSPVAVPGSEFALRADTVVLALGYALDPALSQVLPGIVAEGNSVLPADPGTGRTARPGVWAAGDIVTGADTVVRAMAFGRRAARDIHRYLLEGATP
ncbi:MAG: NAD(P)-dependent oxidoreductase [Chloroflexi bacterium]|nr:NAD(P)-dependent oxidoreductase [Chloroflexota bacterium]